MAASFKCTLITPERQVLEEMINYANIPAWDGSVGLLTGRAPLVAQLGEGILELDTAAGVRYDERQLTAAHASLPLGSRVRVTVADSGRSVMVTINDRPGTRKRIIDLSRAAAEELGIVARGVARVTLTPG